MNGIFCRELQDILTVLKELVFHEKTKCSNQIR